MRRHRVHSHPAALLLTECGKPALDVFAGHCRLTLSATFTPVMRLLDGVQAHITLWEWDFHSIGSEPLQDGLIELNLCRPRESHVNPGSDREGNGGVAKAGNADDRSRIGENLGMAAHEAAQGFQGFVDVGSIGHTDGEIQLPNHAEVVKDLADYFSIGDDNAGVVRVRERGGEDIDLGDVTVHS